MKHIIIAGAARSGKTMLALKLGQEGFVHYKMDSIKRGIDNNFWNGYKDDWKKVSPHMAYLIKTIIDDNQSDIVRNKEFYCIDTCHIYPRDIAKYDLKNTIIVFMGYCDIDVEDKLKNIRKYDIDTWSAFKNDEDLINDTKLDIQFSKEAKKQCEELGIKFFDTSVNFEKTLYEIYKYIKSNQEDEFI